jgi:hypothetical protein
MKNPFALVAALLAGVAASAAPQKHLLLDATTTASATNLKTVLGSAEKSPRNPLFGEEYPWEPRLDNVYPNVVWDPARQLYRCWYTPFTVWQLDEKASTPQLSRTRYREAGVCYAESADGLKWHKPLLAEFPFHGQPSNVVLPLAGDAGVLWDQHDRDPARRFKLLYRPETDGKLGPLATGFSPDGLHWTAGQSLGLTLQADTHNNAIWAPTLDRYVALTRDWKPATADKTKRVRWVARTESPDFVHWAPAEKILGGLDDHHQVYSMPIFYYAGVYLGLPTIYEDLTDRTHVELAWSKDTVHWQRVQPGQALIGNSPRPGAYDWGCVYASVPVFEPGRLAVYYGGSAGIHTGIRKSFLALATFRPDGFAGVTPADSSRAASIVTTPFLADGAAGVTLSADLAAGGSISAVLVDAATGRELVGFAPLTGAGQFSDVALRPADGEIPAGRSVRLKFELTRAVLYSFSL